MVPLSPTARRFVAIALAQQGDEAQQTAWRVWADGDDPTLPSYLAQLAVHALSGMAMRIEQRIADEAVAAAEAAQLENDLGYIADVETVLMDYVQQPMRAYG